MSRSTKAAKVNTAQNTFTKKEAAAIEVATDMATGGAAIQHGLALAKAEKVRSAYYENPQQWNAKSGKYTMRKGYKQMMSPAAYLAFRSKFVTAWFTLHEKDRKVVGLDDVAEIVRFATMPKGESDALKGREKTLFKKVDKRVTSIMSDHFRKKLDAFFRVETPDLDPKTGKKLDAKVIAKRKAAKAERDRPKSEVEKAGIQLNNAVLALHDLKKAAAFKKYSPNEQSLHDRLVELANDYKKVCANHDDHYKV